LAISVKDYDAAKSYLKNKFKVVRAAGGLVRKKDRVLMIYRMKKWDLPKGKRESGERSRATAVREVEDAFGIPVVAIATREPANDAGMSHSASTLKA